MSAIYVCPLSRLAETVSRSGARHIVTIINDGPPVVRPDAVDAANHLRIGVHDICEPMDGMICPAEEHVGDFLRFMTAWDRRAPVVVHCFAGISRSTAAAFSGLCAVRPDVDEAEIAWRLRSRSPQATPNLRIVALADAILGRDGRMVRAVEAIGRGSEAIEGAVFALRLDE
jgi:predicted protein tyrosine phosphatase